MTSGHDKRKALAIVRDWALADGDLPGIHVRLSHASKSLRTNANTATLAREATYVRRGFSGVALLVHAAMVGDTPVCRQIVSRYHPFVLRAMINQTASEHTALMAAAKEGHADIVRVLLDVPGVDVNATGGRGLNALILACDRGRADIVRLLLAKTKDGTKHERAVDVNAISGDGDTALTVAAANGNAEIVRLLLSVKGIDVNAQGSTTALMRAATYDRSEIVRMLLRAKGIDVNARDSIYGRTALMYAASKGRAEIVRLLLGVRGIDVFEIRDKFGRTAVDYASGKTRSAILDMLIRNVHSP